MSGPESLREMPSTRLMALVALGSLLELQALRNRAMKQMFDLRMARGREMVGNPVETIFYREGSNIMLKIAWTEYIPYDERTYDGLA